MDKQQAGQVEMHQEGASGGCILVYPHHHHFIQIVWRTKVTSTHPLHTSQVPRTVDVELCEDLVGSCGVGDVVVVTGIVKVLATGDDLGEATPRR